MKPLSVARFCAHVVFLFIFASAQSQSISGVVNSYYQVTGVNTVTSTVTVTSTAGLSPGTKVLLIQMKGATINSANAASFGDITAIGNTGNYEFNFVCGVSGNDVVLMYQVTRTYTNGAPVQLVTVPRYASVTIADTVKAATWNPATGTGGVVVLESSDTIYLNSPIDASGSGFNGGALFNYTTPSYDCSWFYDVTDYAMTSAASGSPDYYTGAKKGEGIADYILNNEFGRAKQANGGGGGNNHNTGGAGGANFGAGGNGGQRSNEGAFFCHGLNPGMGGASISSYGYTAGNNRIFMGGGGGSGHQNNSRSLPGGNGGGITIVLANVISSSGQKILANGAVPINALCNDPYQAEGDGGGGGGAGGTVIVRLNSVSGSFSLEAKGANGSNSSYHAGPSFVNDCTGPGGGGGGGVAWVSAASLPAGVTSNVTGGANGVVSMFSAITACRGQANGATPGAAGATRFNYVPPVSTPFLCAPLPVAELNYFKGKLTGNNANLWWNMNNTTDLAQYEVERSVNQVSYTSIAIFPATTQVQFSLTDRLNGAGTFFYRLKLTRKDGTVAYSAVVPLTLANSMAIRWIELRPNPASSQLKLSFVSDTRIAASIAIYDVTGRRQSIQSVIISKGNNNFTLPVQQLPQGMYWLVLHGAGLNHTSKFVKSN